MDRDNFSREEHLWMPDMEQLSELIHRASLFAMRYTNERTFLRHVELAVEEIFVNIARYAFQKSGRPGQIRTIFEFRPLDRELLFTFIDDGEPFNPCERELVESEPSSCLIEPGGLGIGFAKGVVDQMEYRYQQGFNVLTLRKKI